MKRFSVLIAAALVVALLAGLAQFGYENKCDAKAVTIVFSFWGDQIVKDSFQKTIDKFEAKYPSIKVKLLCIPYNEYDAKITTMVAANEQLDLSQLESATIAYPLGEHGKLLNLKEMFAKDKEVTLDSYVSPIYYYLDKNTIIGMGQGIETFGLYYNKELLAVAKVATPPTKAEQAWDWDKFVQIAKKLTIDKNGKNASEPGFDPNNIKQYGIAFPKWWGNFGNFVYSNGGDFVTDDGKFGLTKPAAVEAIQKLADLINVHHVSPSPIVEKGMPGMDVALQTKKYAMFFEGNWSNQPLGVAKANYGVGVLPKLKTPVTMSVTGMMAIHKSSKHPEAAWRLLKYLNNPKFDATLYSSGNSLPALKTWLTNPRLVNQWAKNNPAHPKGYQEAFINMLLHHSIPTPTGTVINFNKIMDVVGPALDKVWLGEKTAEQALKECEPKVAEFVKGKRERPNQ